jgi:hypothetical protein
LAYLFDRSGAPIALVPQDKSPDEIVAAVKRWAK